MTWRCYQSSGEPLLRWLTLGFLGFVVIYAPHGAFTGMAHHNIWLFLLYGPASRLAMSVLLFVGLLSYRRPPDDIVERSNPRKWLIWIALFLAVDLVVAWIANSAFAGPRPLTGIGNRRQFIACTQAEIARAKRSGTALSLLSLDLDHFKRINDRYGHPGGDSVLCEFAQKCLEAIRPYDVVARVGGEEFMVLLPGAALDAACAVGERLR